jgi:hypothetical protein
MIGRRVMPDAEGFLPPNLMPGDYGRATSPKIMPGSMLLWWQVCAPDGSQGSLSPKIHAVVEHQDGTITVSPSLDFSKRPRTPGAFHGWLERGVWRSV